MAKDEYAPFTGKLDAAPQFEPFDGTLDGEKPDGPLARGWNKAKQSMSVTSQLATGNAAGAAQTIKQADDYARANPGMQEGKEQGAAWERGDGISGGISEVAGEFAKDWREAPGVVGGLRATAKNLRAMGEKVIEQMPNMAAPVTGMVGGALAGGAAGSAAPIVGNVAGAAVGGWVGASAGNTLVEGGGMTQAALQKAGISPQDTAAVEKYLTEHGDTILGQSATKGAIIGAVDTLTAGLGGRLLNAPARAAADRALAGMGVNMADKAAVKAATQSPEFAAKIAGDATYQASKQGAGNIARNVGAAALDPAGEFAGEFVGQGVATGEWDTKNAALEAFSSIGQSGAMFAGQKAYQALTRPGAATNDPSAQPAPAQDEFTTSPGAADPNAPQNPPATPPEAPDLTTTPGAGVQRDGLEFTREVDTSGLTLQDPAEMERARAATVDYQPGDATPQWDTQPGAAQSRQGLDMPTPEINTDGLGLDPIRQMVKQAADAGGALSPAAVVALDLGATNAQFLGATGRDVQLLQTGPGVTDESNIIDVDAREVPDQRGIPAARRLTNEQEGGARATSSQPLALPAPTNLREGLERIRAQRQEAANAQAAQAPAPAAAPAPGPAEGAGAVEAAGLTENKVGRKDSAQIAQPESVVGEVQRRAAPSAITPTTTQGTTDATQTAQAQQTSAQPAQGRAAQAAPGGGGVAGARAQAASAANGFIDGPDGYQTRISQHTQGSNFLDPTADIGALTYSVRKGSEDVSSLDMVVDRDGKLVQLREARGSDNKSTGRAWVPPTQEDANVVRDLLEQRTQTRIGSPERKTIDAAIQTAVQKSNSSAGAQGTPAPGAQGAAQGPRVILQNRNRSTPSSIAQMRSISTNPDYGRLGFSRDFANGAPVVAGGTIEPAQLGRQDVATASNGRRIPVRYAVVDAAAVLASNSADGSTNIDYGNANVPALRAIAGNGRIAGLQSAYQSGNANTYRQELAQDAALHGIDPSVIAPMAQPVLVRVMPTEEVTADIGDISNTVGNLDLSAVEQANNDANRVSLDALQFSEDGSITPEVVRQFVRAMPQAEQGQLLDTNGQPTRQAVDRLSAAVFAKAYGNEGLTRLYSQAQDSEARLIMSALAQVAPKMARLEGAGALDIRDVVAQAAEIAVNARRQGVAIAKAAQQLDMAADPDVSVVLDLFAANARSARPVAEALGRMADMAYTEATKPAEDMFGTVPRASRTDIINQLRPENERRSQEALEDAAGRESAAVDAVREANEPAGSAAPAEAQAGRPAEDAAAQDGQVAEPGAEYSVRQQFSLFGQEEGDQLQLFVDRGPVPSQVGAGAVAAQREAIAALADMESTASILAKSLSRDFAARQKVRLVGHTVSSAADLAVLAQVYRDPRFETFRLVFTDNSGRVVSQLGISSRLPASSTVLVGDDLKSYLHEVSRAARKTGATSYYMLHNHPSGQATPSSADLELTKTFARQLPGLTMRSHVVIDTNQYSVIDANGKPQFFQQDFAQPPQPLSGPLAGEVIASPADVVRMAQSLQADAGVITLIATDAQYKVKAVTSIPAATLNVGKGLLRLKIARALMRLHSANVFAVSRDEGGLRKLGGIVVDALHVKDDGTVNSLASAGVIASKNLGAFPADRRARVSPDTTENFAYLRFDPSAMQSAGQKLLVRETADLFGDMQEDAAPQPKKQTDKAKRAAERAADDQAAKDENRKRIAQASVRAADRFELGQDPLDSLTGQGSMFDDAPAQQTTTQAAADDDGRERFTLSIEMFGDVPYIASKPVNAGSGEVVSSRVITTKTKLTAANAQALGLPKDKGTVYAWRVSVIRRANGETHSVIEAMATDNGRSPDGEVLAHFKEVENPEAMERIAPAIANAALADWRAAQPQQAPTATETVAQPITRADVTAAQQQAATMIGERIDAMTAGEVNTIARRFLPTMGVKPTVSKERNKAAVTDFTKVNPMAAAAEFGVTLPADVRRALDAEFDGKVVDADPAVTYINGDRAEYTGNTETISGGLFYEVRFTEGAKNGKTAVTQRAPDGANPGQRGPVEPTGIVTPQLSGNPAQFIKIAADSIKALRKVDVDRVLTETPAAFRQEVAAYIRDQRKDLADEVDDVMADLAGAKQSLADAKQEQDKQQPAWHTTIPDSGVQVIAGDEKMDGSTRVLHRIAAEAAQAVTQAQGLANVRLYAYYLPSTAQEHGAVRLFPDDQTPPKPWALLMPEGLPVGMLSKDALSARIRDALRSAPVLTSGDEKKILAEQVGASAKQGAMFSRSPGNAQQARARDAEHLSAVERGDMATAQRLVNEAAAEAGYVGSDYRMQHEAPSAENDGVRLDELRDNGLVPDDYWTHPQWYVSTPEEAAAHRAVVAAMRSADARKAAGKSPGSVAMVVYRAIPKTVKDGAIRNGDWVTPSLEYAKLEGESIPGGYRIISLPASAKNLYWDGNSVAEFGYDDGQSYGYKNTKNNRKLLDAVTRDDDGAVIPLSQRFNARNGDVRFSRAGEKAVSADSNARNVATQMLVDGLKAKWTRAPEIIVARNMQDAQIPQRVRDYDLELKSQGATGEARGFIYKGKVYLLSDELKGPQQIAEVLFHEVLGHYGLRGAFGDSLNSILQQMGTMRRRDVVAKAREYGLFNKDALGGLDKAAASDSQIWAAMSAKDRLSAAEEVLAEMAQTQPNIGFVQRAIAAIRNWLRANVPGFERMRLTDADIVQAYILPARGYVTRSNETAQQAIDRAMLAFSRAYHGTPHRGIEKFSTDKIGTGEGAQAYGWGLYFASKREIADHYRRKLSGDGAVLDGIPMSRMPWYYANLVDDIRNGKDFYQSKAVAISIAQELLQREQRDLAAGKRWAKQAYVAELEGHVAALQRMTEDSYEERENLGQLYEVEIPEDSEMLLWDKPLSEQSEMAKVALANAYKGMFGAKGRMSYDDALEFVSNERGRTGEDAYKEMAKRLSDDMEYANDKAASELFYSLGIKGIKYLDGGSRKDGNGSYNYVIFSGDDVAIERAHFSRTPGDQTQTENFRRWFGDSKVVDADGKPLVFYHGGGLDFTGIRSGGRFGGAIFVRQGAPSGYGKEDHALYIKGPILELDEMADLLSSDRGRGALEKAARRPLNDDEFDLLTEALTDGSHYPTNEDVWGLIGAIDEADAQVETQKLRGAVAGEMGFQSVRSPDEFDGETVMVLTPEQVKSATGNSGNFDPTNPDIRFSRTSTATGTQSAWDAPVQTGFDDVIYKLQDKNIDLKRVLEAITKSVGKVADSINAYLKEELFHKRAAKRVADFGARELKPLMNQMRLAGLSMEDVEEYLHARHAKEANAVIAQRNPGNAGLQDGGSGMTNAAADNYFAKLDPAQRRKLEAVAKSVDAIIDGTRKLYVSYGLEDQAVVDGWSSMYQHYIPLMREDKEGGMGTGQGFSVKGKETKGRTGSTRKVVDILANIASQREKLIVRGEKNRVTQALVGLAQANPNPEFWEVRSQAPTERVFDPKTGVVVDRPDPLFKSRDNVIVAKVKDAKGNVTEQMVVLNEDNPRAVRMAAAMKNLDAGNLEGLLGISAKITRYFSAINTQYNPVFGVVNLVRDVQGAMVNLAATPLAGQQGKIAKDTVSALAGIYSDIRKTRKGGQATSKWAQLWEQMQDDGGTTGYRELFTTSVDRANNLKSILNPEGWMDNKWGKFFTAGGKLKVPMSVAQKGASEIFGWLSDYNEAMENGVRLAAYKAALDKGMSREQAASLAKNLTVNFNRKGQVGQQAGAVYAFFNAAMQGTARIGQTLFDIDGGDISTLRLSKTGKAVVYGGVTLGAIQALALAGAGFDDEDPPEFVRERSLIIPTGGKTYVAIPMPLGLHVIPGIGRHAAEFALSGFDKPAKRAVSMVGMFADAFNPIGNAGLSMQTIAPTAIDPLAALTENKDWTGKPIARGSSNRALPGHTQWKDTATGFSKVVAEAINWVSGGNEYVAGAISPTPDQIDYLLAQVGGGVAREAAKVQQTITTALSGEALPTHKVPLLGRFVGNAASQASQGSAFYANLNKLNELETEIKGLRKDGRFDEAAKLVRENPQATMIAMANRAERDVQKLRRDKRELIAKDASREEVRAKEEQITAVMMRLNEAAERRKAAQ